MGDAHHIQGASHLHLLNHPRAYADIRESLAGAKASGLAAVSLDA